MDATPQSVPKPVVAEATKPETSAAKDKSPEVVVLGNPRRRPATIIAKLKGDDVPFDGDVLATVTGQPERLSIRPQQKGCRCQAHGWVLVREDDGSRAGVRKPHPCACVLGAVQRAFGETTEILTWAPPAGDPLAAEYLQALRKRLDETTEASRALGAERDAKAGDFERERQRLLGVAAAPPPALPEPSDELVQARLTLAGAVDAVAQAERELQDAEGRRRRAQEKLAKLEAPVRAAEQARLEQLTVAASATLDAGRMEHSAALLLHRDSSYSVTLRRLEAAAKRLQRELDSAKMLGEV
jgi:hypothetical protein